MGNKNNPARLPPPTPSRSFRGHHQDDLYYVEKSPRKVPFGTFRDSLPCFWRAGRAARSLLNVLDCLGGGDIAGVDAEAVAEAGHIIVRAVVHGTVVGADHIQALQRGVVGLQGAQLVIRTDAAEGAPGRRLALDRVERAGLALAEVPGIGAELFTQPSLMPSSRSSGSLSRMRPLK